MRLTMEIAMLKRKPASNPDLRKDIAAIRKGLAKAKKCTAELLDGLIETGRALSRAKTKLAHGQWGPWLRENFDLSEDTSENYRRIYSAIVAARLPGGGKEHASGSSLCARPIRCDGRSSGSDVRAGGRRRADHIVDVAVWNAG